MTNLQAIYTNKKSFYGKAKVDDTDGNGVTLYSYDTKICGFKGGCFIRYWGGYSNTTMRHINEFRQQYYRQPMSKSEWDNMPVGYPTYHFGTPVYHEAG